MTPFPSPWSSIMRRQSIVIPLMLATALCAMPATPALSQGQTDLTEYKTAKPSPKFDSPTLALDRLKSVLASNNIGELANLLGLDAERLRANNEAMIAYALIREGAGRQLILKDAEGAKIVVIGDRLWPLPFPLTEDKDGKWSFDTQRGFEEIVNRRIGENELATIDTMHEYVAAQYQYASDDRDGDGIYEFAKKTDQQSGQAGRSLLGSETSTRRKARPARWSKRPPSAPPNAARVISDTAIAS